LRQGRTEVAGMRIKIEEAIYGGFGLHYINTAIKPSRKLYWNLPISDYVGIIKKIF